MMTTSTNQEQQTISSHVQEEIDRANGSSLQPVVFVHGLWLLSNSWDHWRALFEEHGYVTLAPGWPGDPETVQEANDEPGVFARKSIKQITDHYLEVIGKLRRKPVIVGHSFGGLIVEQLAGRGVAAVTVAISPAPFRGVLRLPFSALRSSSAVIVNPTNHHRAVSLSFEQFRYAFGNAVPESEARELYEAYAVPGSGTPIFQAAAANLNPWTEDTVDTKNPERGPMLIIVGEKDHTAPVAIAGASYHRQQRNAAPTEFTEMPGRGHSLTIDGGWREVAETALAFVKQYA
jgi:pimeloyl-ACP methyl ester carboxylesterase